MLFSCKLLDRRGYIKEHFWREGESQEEIINDLNDFVWPKGTYWVIELAIDDED